MLLTKIEAENLATIIRIISNLKAEGFERYFIAGHEHSMLVEGFQDDIREALRKHHCLRGVILGPCYGAA